MNQSQPEKNPEKVHLDRNMNMLMDNLNNKVTPIFQTEPRPEWEKDFVDFYMERGEYEGRKLGPEQYIEFIEKLLLKTRTAEQERVVGIVVGKFDEPHEGTDDVTKEQSDYWVDGYNQALTDVSEAIRGNESGT